MLNAALFGFSQHSEQKLWTFYRSMEKSNVASISQFDPRRHPDSVTADLCVVLSLLSLCLTSFFLKKKQFYVFQEIILFVVIHFNAWRLRMLVSNTTDNRMCFPLLTSTLTTKKKILYQFCTKSLVTTSMWVSLSFKHVLCFSVQLIK